MYNYPLKCDSCKDKLTNKRGSVIKPHYVIREEGTDKEVVICIDCEYTLWLMKRG